MRSWPPRVEGRPFVASVASVVRAGQLFHVNLANTLRAICSRVADG
jgi:hypothetical protein